MKSYVSDQIRLLRCVLEDTRRQCTAYDSFDRDLRTIADRFEHEGLSFLTITLPEFAKDLEKGLAIGRVSPSCFSGWRKCVLPRARGASHERRHGAIPAFLQGMLGFLFDPESGRLQDVPPDEASTIVAAVRQICLLFKKVEAPCTPERTSKAIEGYVSTERSFDSFSPPDHLRDLFGHVSDLLWTPVLAGINPLQLVPHHGPGQTVEGATGNSKYRQLIWHQRLETFFPYFGTAMPLGAAVSARLVPLDLHSQGSLDCVGGEAESDEAVTIGNDVNRHSPQPRSRSRVGPWLHDREFSIDDVAFVDEAGESPVRVITVPKTLKGPRIIAIEPVCMQYTQQAIRDVLYMRIQRTWPMKGRVNFASQQINQDEAMRGSKDGSNATFDLSEASDRVPLDFALRMFDSNPDLRDAIASCRSLRAKLPDGTVMSLRKFASMGSALCFPVEAMYFYTVCIVALLRAQNLPITKSSVFAAARDVYVYGDDIIVPREHAVVVLDYLQEYNCKVNLSKSFWNGKFRESCGMDAYAGYVVTPTYLRQFAPENKRQAKRILSWTATAGLFYKRGYWETARYMYNVVEHILGDLPYVSEDSPALGRITFLGGRSVHRWNRRFQRFEVRAWVARPVYRTDRLSGYAALSKSLLWLERSKRPQPHDALEDWISPSEWYRLRYLSLIPEGVQANHLERTARYGAVALTRRWVPA